VEFWLQAEKDCQRFAWLRRNFRGVTFDEKTGELLSLPLHKFFNVNQTTETAYDALRHRKATIYEKLDGSMIHFFMHPEHGLQAATCRSTQTPQAQEALALAKKNSAVFDLIVKTIADGNTPIFEYVAAHNQIVVQYPKPRLVYLISRNRTDGSYHFDASFPDKATAYPFDFGDIFNQLDLEEFEGYVCHLDNGMMVKAKTEWYLERHRAVDALMRPAYKLYKVVFDGVMDDLIALAADCYKPALTRIYNEAQADLLREKLLVETQYEHVLKVFTEQQEKIPDQPNKLAEFEAEVAALYAADKIAAFKRFREFTGLGLMDAKRYFLNGEWPHGFIRQDEVHEEEKRKRNSKTAFTEAVTKLYPQNFGLLMTLHAGRSPDDGIKERLMEQYREKYPNKLYANLDVEDG
jgi:T4 RnlA family RNA ligase